MSSRRYAVWVGASVAAGTFAGATIRCDQGLVGLAALALAPAFVLAPCVALFRGDPALWVLTSLVGVALTFVTTYATFVVLALAFEMLVSLAGPGLRQNIWAVAAFIGASGAIGASPLGSLQLLAFPPGHRHGRWIVATMIGGAALSPLAYAIVGFVGCLGPLGTDALLGAVGGFVYGVATAIALGLRPSTLST